MNKSYSSITHGVSERPAKILARNRCLPFLIANILSCVKEGRTRSGSVSSSGLFCKSFKYKLNLSGKHVQGSPSSTTCKELNNIRCTLNFAPALIIDHLPLQGVLRVASQNNDQIQLQKSYEADYQSNPHHVS